MCTGEADILSRYGIKKPLYSEAMYLFTTADVSLDLSQQGARAIKVNWISANLIALGGTGAVKASITDQYGRSVLYLSDIPQNANIYHLNLLSKGNILVLGGLSTLLMYAFSIQYQIIQEGAE